MLQQSGPLKSDKTLWQESADTKQISWFLWTKAQWTAAQPIVVVRGQSEGLRPNERPSLFGVEGKLCLNSLL
jgi:hypothetical protein